MFRLFFVKKAHRESLLSILNDNSGTCTLWVQSNQSL